jgi:hypothetical protein
MDPAQNKAQTIHNHGYGKFAVNGDMIELESKMQ